MKRTFCILLSTIFVFALAACGITQHGDDANGATPTPNALATSTPLPNMATSTPIVTISPVPSPEISADGAFEALDLEIFRDVVTSDGSTYNQMIASDPQLFGIDESMVERGWGSRSYDEHIASIDYYEEMLERLHDINADELSDMNKIGYETIEESLSVAIEYRDFYYYDEPMEPMNGDHTMLPLSMVCYEIRCKEDAFNYMYLLEDMPDAIADLEQFEVEKSEQGLFMTENALDKVIESCTSVADEGDDFFLYDYIDEVIEAATAYGLTDAEAEELRARNDNAIRNGILPAYARIADTLDGLRDTCSDFVGAKERGGRWLEYYELRYRDEAAYMGDTDDITKLLKDMGNAMYNELISLIMNDYSLLDRYGEYITMGSTESNMEWLEGFTAEYYPEVPEYQVTYINIPDAIADDFSPAAYLIPPFDDYYHNTILFNPTSDDSNALSTLGHEAVPGHMYQFLYFRNMEGLSLTQQLFCPTGYAEAWTVFSEYFIAHNCDEIGSDYCSMMECESIFSNIFLPAYCSIMVNCEGWTVDDVMNYLTRYNLGVQEYADIMYEYAVDMPVYAMSYAIGFSFLYDVYTDAHVEGADECRAFFENYLSWGPMYLDMLESYLDD